MRYKLRIRLRWITFRRHWERARDEEHVAFFRNLANHYRYKDITSYVVEDGQIRKT